MEEIIFNRTLNLSKYKTSAFLFGPRMTGKSLYLSKLKCSLYLDLLDPEIELEFKKTPKKFWEQISAQRENSTIIIDEVQRVPALLDYVQMGIERNNQRFLMSGSSARKLKRGGANLLGGRALDFRLHPLTCEEIDKNFSIVSALSFGTLPKITNLVISKRLEEARLMLKSYITTYIKEEIQAEAIVRSIGSFQRFLEIAAQSNSQMIEFSNISRESQVPGSTVKEFYTILEDTLLGRFIWPFDRSERKKARPKFYFFDCGVVRALNNRLNDPPTASELGFLFETWFVNELIRIKDYYQKEVKISLWRSDRHEIDVIIENHRGIAMAIECKSGRNISDFNSIYAFQKQFPKTPILIASMDDVQPRRLDNGIEIFSFLDVIKMFKSI